MKTKMSSEIGVLEDYFPKRDFDPHAHDWVQEGTHLICSTCLGNSRHGAIIPSGMMLTGSRGDWRVVPEAGTKRDLDIIKDSNDKKDEHVKK